MAKMSGGAAVVEALRAEGVTHVFGVIGTAMLEVFDALHDAPDITYVGVRHEQNGVHMAELARASPPALIGEITSGARLFGFVGSICGPLAFAIVASKTGGFTWPFVLVAGQLIVFGAFALCRRPSAAPTG